MLRKILFAIAAAWRALGTANPCPHGKAEDGCYECWKDNQW